MNVDHLLTKTITIAAFTGRDANGDPTYAAQTTTSARVNKETQTIRTEDGLDVESSTVLYTPIALGKNDRVWLPGADTANVGAALTVIRCGPIDDLHGSTVMHRSHL